MMNFFTQWSNSLLNDQILYAIGAALFSTPPAIVIGLLYKKAGVARRAEDALVDLDDDKIPEGIKEEIIDRRHVVQAERDLFEAKKALADTKAKLIEALRTSYFSGYENGRSEMYAKDKLEFKKEFEESVEECRKKMVEAKEVLSIWSHSAQLYETQGSA